MKSHIPVRSCFTTLFLILCLTLPAFAQDGDNATDVPTPKTMEKYREDGLTVVLPAEWGKFSRMDESGKQTGFLVDMWTAWSEQSGVDIRLKYLTPDEAITAVRDSEADVVGGLYFSDEVEGVLDASEPLHSSSAVLLLGDEAGVDCANALVEGRIAVVADSYAESLLRSRAGLEGVPFPGVSEAVTGFLTGETDGLVIGYPDFVQVTGSSELPDGVSLCRTLYYRAVSAGVRAENAELLELVNDGFSEISQEQLEAIQGRWFFMAEPSPRWMGPVLPAVAAFAVILVCVFLWLRKRG